MRKEFALLFLLLMCTALLTGCTEVETEPVRPEISAEVYDTGEFRVLVPNGWRVIPITDPFAAGQPMKTDCVFLRKGGESDWNAFEKPYLRIECYDPQQQPAYPAPEEPFWRNVEQLPPMQLGTLIWNGYTADNYHGRAFIGRFALLCAESDIYGYEIVLCFESGGESVKLNDRDLQAILASIEPSSSEAE